jgi:hypothetical protein
MVRDCTFSLGFDKKHKNIFRIHDKKPLMKLSPPQSLLKYLQITYMKFPE